MYKMTNDKIIKKWENEIEVAEDVSKTATAIVTAFLKEHDLIHEFDMHLYYIQQAEDENSDEVLAVAEMMASNIDPC